MPVGLATIPRTWLWPVATLLIVMGVTAARRPHNPNRPAPTDSLARAKQLLWLNNWAEASRVLERLGRSGRLGEEQASHILTRAVEIRGNIESLVLPSASAELTAMLANETVRRDSELRLQILAMRGDVEFQYDLPAAERTWAEVARLSTETGQSGWANRANGEVGCIAFLNGEVLTGLRKVMVAFFRAEMANDVAEKMKTLTALGEGLAEFGREADALRFFDRTLDLYTENPDAYFPFTAYLGKARLLLRTSSPGRGSEMLRAGLEQARRENMRVREARILSVLGDQAIRLGDRAGAIDELRAAVEIARKAGLHRIQAEAASKLASALSDVGKLDDAAVYASDSVVAAERAGDIYHLPQRLAALAETEEKRGDVVASKVAYERGIEQITSLFADLPGPRHESTLVATMGRVFQGYFELALTKLNDPALAFRILESA